MKVIDMLDEGEAYLWAILSDSSGLDQAEFCITDEASDDGCFRAWPYQWAWWRCAAAKQIDQGSRCLSEGTRVLTSVGWKQIETIVVGDRVLTHQNRWRRVTEVYDNGIRDVVKVRAQGMADGLVMTPDHQLLARHGRRGSVVKDGTRQKVLQPPEWIGTDKWHWNDKSQVVTTHCASPAAETEPLGDEWRYVEQAYCAGRQNYLPDTLDEDWLWLYGLYIAEGSSYLDDVHAKAKWCLHGKEIEQVSKVFEKLGLAYSVDNPKDNGRNIQLNSRPMVGWLRANTGRYSHEKYIAPWVFGLPEKYRRAVFEGLTFGDGWTRPNGRIDYSTTSRRLVLDLRLLAQSLGYSFSVSSSPAHQGKIEGRVVDCRESFSCGLELVLGRRGSNVTLEDGFAWTALKDVVSVPPVRTWDLEVDEDHSFVAEGLVVHNSSGKSLSVRFRSLAFPFIHPGQEMVLTAPEGNHLDALTDNVETMYTNNRLPAEMLSSGRSGIKHRPFHMNFANGARIMGRIPQRDGKGVKGCLVQNTPIMTNKGFVIAGEIKPGDMVMTHEGRWRPVVDVIEDVNDCYRVEGAGSFPIEVSCDHRFLGASDISSIPGKTKRDFGDGLFFSDVEKLVEDQFYWATPTEFPHVDVVYPETDRFETECNEFWWLVGLYLADGCLFGNEKRQIAWVSHPENKGRAPLMNSLDVLGFSPTVKERDHSSADIVSIYDQGWGPWLVEHFGHHSHRKKLPAFVLSMKEDFRKALLEGYLAGDGFWNESKNRWESGSASKLLALGMQMLAQSLGYQVNCTPVQPKVTHVNGVELKEVPQVSWRIHISERGHAVPIDGYLINKVKKVVPIGKQPIYNIVVEEDHSYLSGSIMSHNIHPIWLELDEGQDYPEAGWNEIIETIKRGTVEAQWRAHGVTRGIRDKFYDYTQPESGWKVHHLPAMYRPNWTDEERQEKIQLYGHRDSPDFRRNVYGLHGDANSPLFVLHRLMECVDNDRASEYNLDEYWHVQIDEATIREYGSVLHLLDPPAMHKNRYKVFWIGMDVGYTLAPSSICVFAETKDARSPSSLRMIARIMMRRVAHGDQVTVMTWLIDHYRPAAFAMDSTGVGLPLFQSFQEAAREDPKIKVLFDRIKGYNFSEKLAVEFDDSVEIDENDPLGYEKAIIKRNVLEYSSDTLRGLVDDKRLILPWDQELIGEFKGQTWTYSKGADMDMYGRKKSYSQGSFHSLDACRMAALAWKQSLIEEFLKDKNEDDDPPDTIFLDF